MGQSICIDHIPLDEKDHTSVENLKILNYRSIGTLHNKAVIVVRDPRDNLVSLANWFLKGQPYYWLCITEPEFNHWRSKNNNSSALDEIVSIDPKSPLHARWFVQYLSYKTVVNRFLEKPHRFLIIKFEDLISEEMGGGDISRPRDAIKKIYSLFQKSTPSDQQIDIALKKA